MIDIKQIFNKFLELEEDLDLFNKRVDNVLFWERVRTPIIQNVYRITTGEIIPGETCSWKSKLPSHISTGVS